MNLDTSIAMCHSLTKSYSTGVRLYEGENLLYYYSVNHIHPDPVLPYLGQILSSRESAGIITTPLYQFYGFLTVKPGLYIILGPTRMLLESDRDMEFLLAMLGIDSGERDAYIRLLCSAPLINADRFAWLLASLMTALHGETFPVEKVWVEVRSESGQKAVRVKYTQQRLDDADNIDTHQAVYQSYAWEQLLASYVENGQPEQLRDLFSAPPKVVAGTMAQDNLRQMKNMGICAATGVSRAAIRGGLDPRQAFPMSDLYIQKLELMQDIFTIERLIQEMVIDFAEQVAHLHHPAGGKSRFYKMCAQYVSENIFTTIRAGEMAAVLGYTRAYLCTRFKQEAGLSLSQYVQHEKVAEAKRLLQFSDQKLGEIAALLDFSSQSHFQTVFRKITGETPMTYRIRTKIQSF